MEAVIQYRLWADLHLKAISSILYSVLTVNG